MFKKVVSQLSFSPATVERVADYARSVRQRQRLHGWAIVALIVFGVVYGITLAFPPETAADPAHTPEQPVLNHTLQYTHSPDITEASSDQSITWGLVISNPSNMPITDDIWFLTDDINHYADITSISDSGIVSDSDHRILWPDTTIAPGGSTNFTVTARVHSPISEKAGQLNNPASHDCRITTTFGTTEEVAINCPVLKRVEAILQQLPAVPPAAGITGYIIIFSLNLIAYISLRLRSKELRIIRTQLNTGGL